MHLAKKKLKLKTARQRDSCVQIQYVVPEKATKSLTAVASPFLQTDTKFVPDIFLRELQLIIAQISQS